MHWFSRAVMAVVVGSAFGTVWFGEPSLRLISTGSFNSALSAGLSDRLAFGVTLMWPPIVVALAAYGLTTRYFMSKTAPFGETRCRKCNYILRGLTEPRCPECGEGI